MTDRQKDRHRQTQSFDWGMEVSLCLIEKWQWHLSHPLFLSVCGLGLGLEAWGVKFGAWVSTSIKIENVERRKEETPESCQG